MSPSPICPPLPMAITQRAASRHRQNACTVGAAGGRRERPASRNREVIGSRAGCRSSREGSAVPAGVAAFVCGQLGIADPLCLRAYAGRPKTAYEHQWEIRRECGYREFSAGEAGLRAFVAALRLSSLPISGGLSRHVVLTCNDLAGGGSWGPEEDHVRERQHELWQAAVAAVERGGEVPDLAAAVDRRAVAASGGRALAGGSDDDHADPAGRRARRVGAVQAGAPRESLA